MTDHLLHLDSIHEGYAVWRFTCEHASGDPKWRVKQQDGSPDPNFEDDECWLDSWTNAVGDELLAIKGPITTLPIPIRPSDDWDYDNGGTFVLDEGKP